MRRSEDFAQTIRKGARAGRDTLVVHCLTTDGPDRSVGFVVAKTVGNAVVRNRVRRRLRGVVVEQNDSLPQGTHIVVRALPRSASATYLQISTDFLGALRTAVRRSHDRTRPTG